MADKCPKCGRLGYPTIKMVTNPAHTRLYACLYYRHKHGRPAWCYIKRLPEADPGIDTWWKNSKIWGT